MQFNARVKPESHVHENWTYRKQIAGYYKHIKFSRTADGSYVANDLNVDDAALLSIVPYVVVEIIGNPAGNVAIVETVHVEDSPTKSRGRPKKAVMDSDASLLE